MWKRLHYSGNCVLQANLCTHVLICVSQTPQYTTPHPILKPHTHSFKIRLLTGAASYDLPARKELKGEGQKEGLVCEVFRISTSGFFEC